MKTCQSRQRDKQGFGLKKGQKKEQNNHAKDKVEKKTVLFNNVIFNYEDMVTLVLLHSFFSYIFSSELT